jgi:hypothetical protein
MRQEALDALLRLQAFTKQLGKFVFHNPLHGKPWMGPSQSRSGGAEFLLIIVRRRNPYQARHAFA